MFKISPSLLRLQKAVYNMKELEKEASKRGVGQYLQAWMSGRELRA